MHVSEKFTYFGESLFFQQRAASTLRMRSTFRPPALPDAYRLYYLLMSRVGKGAKRVHASAAPAKNRTKSSP